MKAKTKVSKIFDVDFELARGKTEKIPAVDVVAFFVKNFGTIKIAKKYRITVEVV